MPHGFLARFCLCRDEP